LATPSLAVLLRRPLALAVLSLGLAGPAFADEAKTPAPPVAAVIAPTVTAPIDLLMSIGPLPDLVQGSPSAPNTIIEYASMTCAHCAAFHDTTWAELKSKYIDSGRAKFILREFPLDPLATAAFMLGRCAGADKRNLLIDQLFTQQKTWAFVDKPIEPLLAMVKTVGFTQTDFETCLRNQDLYEQVSQSRERAAEAFNIDSTPTFFVNGRKLTGELTIVDFDKALEGR
jgi:protein-disulfide isomerase